MLKNDGNNEKSTLATKIYDQKVDITTSSWLSKQHVILVVTPMSLLDQLL